MLFRSVRRDQETLRDIENLFEALDIVAPKQGMVIYSYDRLGTKIKVGSTVSRWAPRIAELPDLSSMISKTFINEIDISKVKVGQKVKVGVDAFPDKVFDGDVITVANIGQTLPNGDTKVFEVNIKLFGSDKDLRPAMTTSNVITINSLEDALYLPLEAVFKTDSSRYVYTYNPGLTRQIVELGVENANYAVVLRGLEEGMIVLLNAPADAEDLPLGGIEIYEDLKKRAEEAKKDSTEQLKTEEPRRPRPEFGGERMRPGGMGEGPGLRGSSVLSCSVESFLASSTRFFRSSYISIPLKLGAVSGKSNRCSKVYD